MAEQEEKMQKKIIKGTTNRAGVKNYAMLHSICFRDGLFGGIEKVLKAIEQQMRRERKKPWILFIDGSLGATQAEIY